MSADPFRDKLARLRRELPGAAARAQSDGVRARLARRDQRSPPDPASSSIDPELCAGRLTLGLPERLQTQERADGRLHVRREALARDTRHGQWSFDEARAADPRAFALVTADPTFQTADLEQAVYLDTETSGLAGGTGTYVFLVGLGRFEEQGFELWQGFLEHPAQERALLAEAALRIRAAPLVVSFFGKSFDRHRLEDKMRVHGIASPFVGRPHLDLYHPLRRITQGALVDAKLRTLEQALCGVVRADDLSGAFAPAAWFDFLAERPHRLEGVLRHNADDVKSLVVLAAYLGRVLAGVRADGAELGGPRAERERALVERLVQAGRPDEALSRARRELEQQESRALAFLVVLALEHSGRRAEALESCLSLCAGEDAIALRCSVNAARLLRRLAGDHARRSALLSSARALLDRRFVGPERMRILREIETEAARIMRVCARG